MLLTCALSHMISPKSSAMATLEAHDRLRSSVFTYDLVCLDTTRNQASGGLKARAPGIACSKSSNLLAAKINLERGLLSCTLHDGGSLREWQIEVFVQCLCRPYRCGALTSSPSHRKVRSK